MNLAEEYQRYLAVHEGLTPHGSWVAYDWVDLPASLDIAYLAYGQMLNEHSREIANSINQLQRITLSLKAWDKLLHSRDDVKQHKFSIVSEFVDPNATVAINLPYVIRSRFIYSTAHLSHQVNQSRNADWKDDLPLDSEIYFAEADKYGAPWRMYNKLKQALEKIASGNYKEVTNDFRNKYNHRYSPRIEIGLTGLVARHIDESGQINYSFGYNEPLKLVNIVDALEKQHDFCLIAFNKYQKLVKQQINDIESHSKKLHPKKGGAEAKLG